MKCAILILLLACMMFKRSYPCFPSDRSRCGDCDWESSICHRTCWFRPKKCEECSKTWQECRV
ncbi:hypothetical protein ACJMK2_024970, partial [Sinanodonta woodiana]